MFPQPSDVPGEENSYLYRPRGVAVVIAPWNFPLAILTGMTVAALVTGNTVVMKPAEQSSVVAARLHGSVAERTPPRRSRQLSARCRRRPRTDADRQPPRRSHRVHRLTAVGLAINSLRPSLADYQTNVRRVIAEMGGKNAIIVDDDADLDEAVLGVVRSAFGYAGPEVLGLLPRDCARPTCTTPFCRGWSTRPAA